MLSLDEPRFSGAQTHVSPALRPGSAWRSRGKVLSPRDSPPSGFLLTKAPANEAFAGVWGCPWARRPGSRFLQDSGLC